jgi:hypothetical protein
MFAVFCSPNFWNEIDSVVTSMNDEILLKCIDSDIDIAEQFEKVSRISVKHLIIDISAIQDTKKLLIHIKRYRYKFDKSQIIIIAPNVVPGDTLMHSLVTMGIYDIIAINGENLESISITPHLIDLIENPATYKKAVKWFIDDDVIPSNDSDTVKDINRSAIQIKEKTVTVTKEKIVGNVVVAVAGTMSRIGTTHTVLSIAEFLKNLNFRVAVVEYHQSNHFNLIKEGYEDIEDNVSYFNLNGLDYYPYSNDINLLDIIQQDYNYIVMDMGKFDNCDKIEFKRSNARIIVSGSKSWELTELELILRQEDSFTNSKNIYYFNFTDVDTFNDINESMIDAALGQFKCHKAIFNPNPFRIDKATHESFTNLLKDFIPINNKKREINNTNILKNIFINIKRKESK